MFEIKEYNNSPLILMASVNKVCRINVLQISETVLRQCTTVGYDKSFDPPKPYNKEQIYYEITMNNGRHIDSYYFNTEKEAEEWYNGIPLYLS